MIEKWSQWTDQLRKSQLTPLIITIILVIAAILTTWQLVTRFQTQKVKPGAPLIKVEAPPPSVANLHLMGSFDAKTADIPTTQLQLTLQGTVVVANDPSRSQALIYSPGMPTKVYKEGDFVPGNAKVEKIEQHVVIINDNGDLQKLRMPLHTLQNIKLPRS